MTPVEVYLGAAEAFDGVLHQVTDDQWATSTPCPRWDVRALVNHVVSENLWLPALLAGLTVSEVGFRFDGDLLGVEPVQAWLSAHHGAVDALDALTVAGAHDRTVALSSGETPAEEYLWQVAADHLVHAWDLAAAIGADDRLDGGLVRAVTTWFAANEAAYRAAGAVGPRVELAAGAGAQAQLLAMFGRTRKLPDAMTVVARFGAAFDAQDVDAVMAMMTLDCVFESTAPPDGIRYEGQDAVREAWTAFFAGSEGTRFVTESCTALGDRVVAQWRYDWSGSAPGHVRGVDVFTVREGLVAEKASYVKG